jgi:transcriptional regulator with XRE-family HTH domain
MHSEIFYTNVLRILHEMGLTKSDLATQAGISVSFLSDLTNGKANPSLRIMAAIADALESPLPALLEFNDLNSASLAELAGRKIFRSVPPGMACVSAILTDFQAFQVKKWDQANRKLLMRRDQSS